MKKYIKFLLPIVLIILVIVVILLSVVLRQFDNSSLNNDNNDKDNDQTIGISFSDLYDMAWLLESADLYKDGELIHHVPVINDKYIKFNEDELVYCLSFEDEKCTKHKYSYNDDKIKLYTDSIIGKGEYNIKFTDVSMELSSVVNGVESVYVFRTP